MKVASPAGFDRALASGPEMLACLRSEAIASQMKKRLRELGLRPTRTRVALAIILFSRSDRHVSAEMLFEEASKESPSFTGNRL
jgi:hypothetical protein